MAYGVMYTYIHVYVHACARGTGLELDHEVCNFYSENIRVIYVYRCTYTLSLWLMIAIAGARGLGQSASINVAWGFLLRPIENYMHVRSCLPWESYKSNWAGAQMGRC